MKLEVEGAKKTLSTRDVFLGLNSYKSDPQLI